MPSDPVAETIAAARRLSDLGYDHLWLYDHLTWRHYRDRPWHGIYPMLAALAVATERIRLGTMVANPNIRHPYVLAKDAMTIDHLAEGRLTIGVGAGGLGFDATVFGAAELSPRERIDRLEEFVGCLDGLLRGELQNHQGQWYTIDEARMLPGCVQQPRLPLAVAAGGPRGLRLAAATADAWITNGSPTAPDSQPATTHRIISEQVARLDDAAAALGRDPSTIDRIVMIDSDDGRPLRSVEAFRDYVGRYGELGFTDLVFHHPRPDDPKWNDPVEMIDEIAEVFLSPA